MGREWFAVYSRLIRTPKFRRLSDAAQLSLLYIWALAGDQPTEATWGSLDDLADLLDMHGRSREPLTELVQARWLDVDGQGQAAVHDWDMHQYDADAEARRRYEAAYMREWRNKRTKTTKTREEESGSSPVNTGELPRTNGRELRHGEDRRPMPGGVVTSDPSYRDAMSRGAWTEAVDIATRLEEEFQRGTSA
jgi:hypothetical protein